jgi:1-acyl-sn-glycerol-3-phosphate acyltransferase
MLCGLFAFILRQTSEQLQDARVANTQLYSWLFLRVAGFRIELQADPSALDGRTALWVSNHLSYVDAMLFSAIHPVAFITSKEVESTFFLGFMAKLTGCVFIERRSRDFLDREVSVVTSVLKRGVSIGLYPEATSTGGERVLPFKHAFFKAAIEADCPVQPLVLQYERIDGKPIDRRNRDSVFYYGDVSFAKQFWGMLSCGRIDVTIRALKPIESSEAPVESGYDHHALAMKAEERIAALYRPIRIPTIS